MAAAAIVDRLPKEVPTFHNPLAVEAEIRRRENELLARGPEEDGVSIAAVEDGDHDTLPPAVVVEGVDILAEAEAAALPARRDRADEDDIDGLA